MPKKVQICREQVMDAGAIFGRSITTLVGQVDTESWAHWGRNASARVCHLPSSAGNTVTMELATVNDENPCGDRGLDAVCPPVAIDGTDGEKWRRRESNPRPVIPRKRPLRA